MLRIAPEQRSALVNYQGVFLSLAVPLIRHRRQRKINNCPLTEESSVILEPRVTSRMDPQSFRWMDRGGQSVGTSPDILKQSWSDDVRMMSGRISAMLAIVQLLSLDDNILTRDYSTITRKGRQREICIHTIATVQKLTRHLMLWFLLWQFAGKGKENATYFTLIQFLLVHLGKVQK